MSINTANVTLRISKVFEAFILTFVLPNYINTLTHNELMHNIP